LLTASIRPTGSQKVTLHFSPALPMGAAVLSVEQDGKPLHFEVEDRGSETLAVINTDFSATTQIVVRYKPGVALEADRLPLLEGDTSRNLRIIRTRYANGLIELTVEGRPGQMYEVRAYTPLKLAPVAGIAAIEDHGDYRSLELTPPADSRNVDNAGYVRWLVRAKAEQ
jgi:hypothetical protein